MRRATLRMTLAVAICSAGASCGGTPVDVSKVLRITDVTTGWFDAGVVEGYKNKLVPSVAFRLKNIGESFSGSVQINAIFRRVGDSEEWGSALFRGVGSDGLTGGAVSPPIVLRSNLGYTGTDPRSQLLQNKLFVDAKVQVFAKHGSAQWVKLGEYPVDRQLLTR